MLKTAGAQAAPLTVVEDTSRTVAGIDKFTFVSDENMQVCYIGPDVAYIDEQAFFGCFALKAIIVDKANSRYRDIDGVLYTKDLSEIILYPPNHFDYLKETGKAGGDDETGPETYTIPEGVRRVATGCFYKARDIKEIALPSTLEEIGDMAFFKCQELKLLVLPDGLREIGNDSFSYCSAMRGAMYIPSSVKSIGHHCFYKCDALEAFYLGAAGEEDILLGGKWQPKGENSFSADPPFFGKTRAGDGTTGACRGKALERGMPWAIGAGAGYHTRIQTYGTSRREGRQFYGNTSTLLVS